MASDNFNGFLVTTSSRQVVFTGLLSGGGQWVIDTTLLAGQPALTFRRRGPTGRVRVGRFLQITLSNARYPGTTIPADLSLSIAQVDSDTDSSLSVDLQLAFGSASFTWQDADFGTWLAGRQGAIAPITATGAVVRFAGGGAIDFGPAATATLALTPVNWTIGGTDACSIDAFGVVSTGTSLSLALLDTGPTTTIVVQASAPLSVPLPSPTPLGTLTPLPAFTTLTAHTSETGQRASFSSTTQSPLYVLELRAGIADLDGAPARFELIAGQVSFDAGFVPLRTTLSTRGKPTSPLFVAAGLGMRVPPTPEIAGPLNLEMSFDGSTWTVTRATLPLPGLFLPLDDGIAEPGSVSGALSLVGDGPNWIVLGPLPPNVPRVHIEDFGVRVTRATDLLTLEISASNMSLEASEGTAPTLGPNLNGQFTFWRVVFPPQHIAEQAFYRGREQQPNLNPQPDDPLPPPPVAARMAGRTRLAFLVPAELPRFTVTLANLLDWKLYQQAGTALDNPGAAYGPPPALHPPDPIRQTAIELPQRLLLSLDDASGWSHVAAAAPGETNEIWNTRLARRKPLGAGQFVIDERPASPARQGRAFWSPDLDTPQDPFPKGSLNASVRTQLVRLTSGLPSGPESFTHTFDVQQLMLSAFGATVHIDAGWNPPPQSQLDVTHWQHVASFGRDQYVRVGHRGCVAAYGHRATLVSVSERRFIAPADGAQAVAYLVQFDYVVVTEPVHRYAGDDLPFTEIEFVTRITPPLDQPQAIPNSEAFWIAAGGAPFLFELTGVDRLGRHVAFRAPAIFVPDDANFENNASTALDAYRQNQTVNTPVDFGRQRIAFAEPADAENTSFETATLSLDFTDLRPGGQGSWKDAGGNPLFRPRVQAANIHHAAATALAGAPDTVNVRYVSATPTQADVFLALSDKPHARLGADKAGVASPAYTLTGISRTFGAVPDISQGAFDAATVLDPTARFLGDIPLASLIGQTNQIPHLQTVVDTGPDGNPVATVTTFEWHPPLHNPNIPGLLELTFDDLDAPLDLTARVTTQLATPPVPPVSELRGRVGRFKLAFASLVALHFDSMRFESVTGKKPSIDVQLNKVLPVEFLGDLTFINALRDLIPSNGFSPPAAPTAGTAAADLPAGSGPFVDVTPSGVTAGYALAIPSVGVGIFSLENIRLAAALALPFEDKPVSFDFHFSERDHKFLLTVDLLAGGGYLAISLDSRGIQRLEFAIEFGANVALNLFVATGSVHILAGANLVFSDTNRSMTGYLRAGGEMTVLGLISVAVEFYLGLRYDAGDLYGIASLSIEVSVAFISKSVTVTLERRFPGSVPGVGQLMSGSGIAALADILSEADWTAYAAAFA